MNFLVKVVQDLWILLSSGTVLFDRVFDERIDANLFGAMMSALESFARELSEGGLTNFEMNKKCFSILKKKEILFIASYPKKNQEKKVIQELKTISGKFLGMYDIDVNTFEGEVSEFKQFEREIEDSLDKVVDKMQKGFW